MLKKEEAIPWPGTLAIVHSYIAYKAGKKMMNTFLSLLIMEDVILGVGQNGTSFTKGNSVIQKEITLITSEVKIAV